MVQEKVRINYVRKRPGKRRIGRKGYWYKCAHCGKWCGRPGWDKVKIPKSQKMEVDHIRSWSNGGSNRIWNLQPLCNPCNRKKSSESTLKDRIRMVRNAFFHPVDTFVFCPVRKAFRQSRLLKKLGLNTRK